MQVSGVGTAVMFAVAAVLWFAYLVPTWVRRREYLATERNATRLQQTLRIMAETSETPRVVRAEATARSAAHQERLLRERTRQQEARERAALAATRTAQDPRIAAAEARRARLRRGRLAASLLLLAALVVAGAQTWLAVTRGPVTGSWVVLGSSGGSALIAIGALRTLARRRIPAPVLAESAAPVVVEERRTAAPRRKEWTPVPVPRPRYLGSPVPQRVAPIPDADRLLREASEHARSALRAAHGEARVVAFPTPAPAAEAPRETAPSPWAAMGVVGEVAPTAPDLDEVLRRRRAAG